MQEICHLWLGSSVLVKTVHFGIPRLVTMDRIVVGVNGDEPVVGSHQRHFPILEDRLELLEGSNSVRDSLHTLVRLDLQILVVSGLQRNLRRKYQHCRTCQK